jgi:hypothetical protein
MRLYDWLIIIVFCSVLGACSFLLKLQGQAEEKTVQGIEAVCKNTDEDFRQSFLAGVNAKAAPNSISITCAVPAL